MLVMSSTVRRPYDQVDPRPAILVILQNLSLLSDTFAAMDDLTPNAVIAWNVRRLRRERGWTQAELADRIGIIRELISNYERQRIRPNYEMVIRLAFALEVTTDELLGVKPSKSNGSQPSLKIQRRMKKRRRQFWVWGAVTQRL